MSHNIHIYIHILYTRAGMCAMKHMCTGLSWPSHESKCDNSESSVSAPQHRNWKCLLLASKQVCFAQGLSQGSRLHIAIFIHSSFLCPLTQLNSRPEAVRLLMPTVFFVCRFAAFGFSSMLLAGLCQPSILGRILDLAVYPKRQHLQLQIPR